LYGFYKRVQPKLCVILETELWPNLLHICDKWHLPVIIINARLSLKSFLGYKKFGWIVKAMLQQVTCVVTQSDLDGNRFLQLGLKAKQLVVSANIKFDITISKKHEELGKKLRACLGERPIWIAASTHEGEEAKILSAFSKIKENFSTVLLILVPRHPERFTEITTLVENHGFTVVRRSTGETCSSDIDVYIGDSIGELGILYQTADVAFIGGSLVPVGGHNMLEAAAIGIPIVCGPYLYNFIEVSQKMLKAKAMLIATDVNALTEIINEWLLLQEQARIVGLKGLIVVAQNQGATQKIISVIEKICKSLL